MEFNDIFKKLFWRTIVQASDRYEQYISWTITGIAAVLALIIGNIDSIRAIVDQCSLKTALILMTLSIIFGVASKFGAVAVSVGRSLAIEIESQLNSDAGQQLMDGMDVDIEKLASEISEPFWWPMSVLIKKSMLSGVADPLKGEKLLVGYFCFHVYCNIFHIILGALGLAAIAYGIS